MGAELLIIHLPFPAPELMPNRKNGKHWTSTIGVKNAQKTEAAIRTKEALRVAGPTDYGTGNIPISLLFCCPDKRKRDIDNLLSASKTMLDAVAQELGVCDSRFKPILLDSVLGPKEGGLVVTVGANIKTTV